LIVLSGSLPAQTPHDFFGDLLRSAAEVAAVDLGRRTILDLRGPEFRAALVQRPLLAKMNHDELEATVGQTLPDEPAVLAAMRALCRNGGAGGVAVTRGAAATLLVTEEAIWRLMPPQAAVVNPIGSGDCFAAAAAWALRDGATLVEAVRCGVAAGTENARSLLPARLDPAIVRQTAGDVLVQGVSLGGR